jgi:hypothetical protein
MGEIVNSTTCHLKQSYIVELPVFQFWEGCIGPSRFPATCAWLKQQGGPHMIILYIQV